MKKVLALILLGALAGAAWVALKPKQAASTPLMVFCAAGLKKPVSEIAEAFQKETGTEVRLQFGGTGTLLSQLRVAKQGDLFIAADDGALADARKTGTTQEEFQLVKQKPVLAVAKGNPKGLTSLASLKQNGIKLALPNPEAASIGRVTQRLLGAEWTALAEKAAVMKPTVTEIAADLSLGAVDAAIVWDSTVPQFKDLEAVMMPELAKHAEFATAAVLGTSKQPPLAMQFARYMTAPEKGSAVFTQHGFTAVPGDKWALRPDLILYSGSVNRRAIEDVLKEFAGREGITVTTTYNGCGILCAAMKTMGDSSNPKFPDVYYACDVCFVPPVAKEFPEAVILTEAEIVIATPKDNPHGIRTLADLAKPGLRVGLCNAEQSTLGFLTHSILKSMNLLESVTRNASSQVPTGDFLVNQMRTGSLDAVVVYRINLQAKPDEFAVIPLPADKAKALQPFAVRQDSPYQQMGRRLLTFLRGHRESFEEAGFVWKGDATAIKSSDIVLPDWLKQ
ncbi:MAG: molybdate ABC transporter substrate-binding protein [Prosthecobacter sp.]|jgi:molybdate transport system substrate-binding protein|uniref:molybdate ABC transporter substrate-binding protein n=1 Tax=Prosthecobacter sp. TaxID=1965333 RepID=UPI0019DCD955|nr:molybdate ABC transporter substrate-binding protein [Prosthecobacter sp.]MBE2284857.1 molybdate ABC transporter substrate-binding protein [Prosthecobacter sp.]